MFPRALLIALMMPLAAEEAAGPLAVWAFGAGTRGAEACVIGDAVADGDVLAVGGLTAARLELIGLPGSDLILRPGSRAALARDPAHPGRVVVDLQAGAIEVDLAGAGDEAEVEVRGAALGVRGHGCLLLVEREGATTDYVAVVGGQAMAGLRPGLSVADDGTSILLQARQGLRCSAGDGLAEVDQLDGRPQLLAPGSLEDQGQEAGSEESWQRDGAALATSDPQPDGSVTGLGTLAVAPVAMPEPPTVPASELPSAEPPPVAAVEPAAAPAEPPPAPPAPPAQAPVTRHGRAGAGLIDALSEDRNPGWQRRGRGATPFPAAN